MDKKELVLRKLATIGLTNQIIELNNIIELQNEKSDDTYNKSKQLFYEMFQKNKTLLNEKQQLEKDLQSAKDEISNLNSKLIYQQTIIEKIPNFLLKFILKSKDIKLLSEGSK